MVRRKKDPLFRSDGKRISKKSDGKCILWKVLGPMFIIMLV
jgi:hypothetical protein